MVHKSLLGIFWSFVDRISGQLISFVIGIVLARLLTPNYYGLIGILTIFINLSNVFIESGFSNALIRKLDRSDYDLATAFYFNIAIGLIAYFILFIISPYISGYFNSHILCDLLRIVGLSVLFNSLCIVQNAIITADLNTKLLTKINIFSQLPMGGVAIVLAYNNFGVYSLAIQFVGGSLLRTILYWWYAKWFPTVGFKKKSFDYLWGFGSKLVAANLIGTVFNEIYSVVIGKCVGKQELGYYAKARSLSVQPDTICTGIIQKVTVPIFSFIQNDKFQLLTEYRKYTRMILCLMSPLSIFLIVCGKPLILVLWGEQWEGAVMLFQLLVFAGLWSPISTLNLTLLQVLNRTGFMLRLEFFKKFFSILIIAISIPGGIVGIVVGQIFIAIIADVINMRASKLLINYEYSSQIKDILFYLLPALGIGGITMYITLYIETAWISIVLSCGIIYSLYLLYLYLMRDIAYFYFINICSKIYNRYVQKK